MNTDYQTEQQAAAFWAKIDARIAKALSIKRQSGIVPGVAYGSTIFDSEGHAVWGGAGGSGGGNLPIARYMDNIGRSFTTGTETTVNYAVPGVDTDSLVTTGSSWVFTCPTDGEYHVLACWTWNTYTWVAGTGSGCSLHVARSGTIVSTLDRWEGDYSSSGRLMMKGADILTCTAGQTISIIIRQGSGTTRSGNGLIGLNYVAIHQITSR